MIWPTSQPEPRMRDGTDAIITAIQRGTAGAFRQDFQYEAGRQARIGYRVDSCYDRFKRVRRRLNERGFFFSLNAKRLGPC